MVSPDTPDTEAPLTLRLRSGLALCSEFGGGFERFFTEKLVDFVAFLAFLSKIERFSPVLRITWFFVAIFGPRPPAEEQISPNLVLSFEGLVLS